MTRKDFLWQKFSSPLSSKGIANLEFKITSRVSEKKTKYLSNPIDLKFHMPRRKRTKGTREARAHTARSRKNPHVFHRSLLQRYGGLAILLTVLFIFTEVSSTISTVLLANMAASILGIGIILAMFLTASRMRRSIQQQAL